MHGWACDRCAQFQQLKILAPVSLDSFGFGSMISRGSPVLESSVDLDLRLSHDFSIVHDHWVVSSGYGYHKQETQIQT